MIVTVTLNAALDRSLTVPVFHVGHRHRSSDVTTLAGGKGINVARALKRLDVPVVATGLAGGRTGTRIVEELTTEAILNDFVRIRDESRTSTLVVDPTSGTHTEINEWGPKVSPSELETLVDKLRYLAQGAEAVVFAGSLPRGVEESFYATAAREVAKRGVRVVLDSDGEPLRLGLESEPWLVSPNLHEAEQLVGQELVDDDDFLMALDTIAEMGARNVHITTESGCFALIREERQVRRFRVDAPHLDPVSVVGAGDALLAQFVASHLEGATPDDALRAAVAAGAASVLVIGGGCFEPAEARRLVSLVEVRELVAH
ncbi:MAG: 1-phosphofructokinase family hexose kinase [Gaiella sp.]